MTLILLGSSDSQDGCIPADACKLAWAVADAFAQGQHHFLAPTPLAQYAGSSQDGCILGVPTSDRLLIPHPDPEHVEIHESPQALKAAFLAHAGDIAHEMAPGDVLFVALCAPGRPSDGAVFVSDKDEANRDTISVSDLKGVLQDKPSSARIVLWVPAWYADFWRRKMAVWEVPAASRPDEESAGFRTQPASLLRFPTFSHSSLNRLRLLLHQETSPAATPARAPSRTNSVLIRTLPARMQSCAVDSWLSERFLALASALNDDVDAYRVPTTPTINKISTWVLRFGTPTAPPGVDAPLIVHALGYQAHLLFLANAPALTGAWPVGAPPADDVDISRLFKSTPLTNEDLWPVLQASHRYCFARAGEAKELCFSFKWHTAVVSRFLVGWYRAGCPAIDLERVRAARAEVEGWLRRVGEEEPALRCHCGGHLLLTETEYVQRMEQYRDDERKEEILAVSPPPSGDYRASSIPELCSVASAIGLGSIHF